MNKAPVSVIIPFFNAEKSIIRALESIKNQTFLPEEIICVDDCSNDKTVDLIHEFIIENNQITIEVLKTKVNGGPSVARNLGWDNAKCEYIAFLDADNAWHPQKIELQYQLMASEKDCVLSGHAPPITRFTDHKFDYISLKLTKIVKLDYEFLDVNRILKSNPFETSSIMCKKDIKHRFFPSKRYCEDYLLWMQIGFDNLPIITFIPSLTYVFKTPNSLSSKKWLMRWGDITNYWVLYQSKKINFFTMTIRVLISLLKYFLFLVSPDLHLALKKQINSSSLT